MAKRDVLRDGEILCEVERAFRRRGWGRGRNGALILTDLRLVFISTTVMFRRSRVELWELPEIENVEVFDSKIRPDDGAIRVVFGAAEPRREPVDFENIDGGTERATELAVWIERQARLLAT